MYPASLSMSFYSPQKMPLPTSCCYLPGREFLNQLRSYDLHIYRAIHRQASRNPSSAQGFISRTSSSHCFISRACCIGSSAILFPFVFHGRGRRLRARKLVRAFGAPPKSSPGQSIRQKEAKDTGKAFIDEELDEKESLSAWDKTPQRYKLIVTTSLAFVICNMDKVNLSVAIIPMSHQFGWNASTAGLVQSSFFWGYALSQLPGGWFATKFTGKAVLGAGVLMWSLATAMVPIVASFMPGLLFCRLMVGLGEGVSPSAATDLIVKTVPITERSRAVAFVFNGLSVGSIIGLLLAPALIEHFGWESVFYIFGILGVLWCIGFKFTTNKVESKQIFVEGEDKISRKTKDSLERQTHGKLKESFDESKDTQFNQVPWKAFLRSPAVWAMIYAHFCGNWGHYCNLAWLPSYFREELNLDLTNAALVSILPPLGSMLVSAIAAPMADHLISKGVNTTLVRKICQTIAFLSPATCMTVASLDFGLSPWMTVSILTSGLALSSFALAGLYCTHQDISPKYASILLGITNTAGAIPGILGVYLTGYLLDQTHSWSLALFAPSIFFCITGAVVWNTLASSEPQSFDH